ncbi:uncharacterized protein LOC132719263 [Ruditapes philippinarum]|uniref:uncharacterized protein LOC132719263 n=1 Tax=Ruditapes philippinarum TaxID=129788 RepID=UPI00295AB7EF|nr:uncharacterized protein LOC132719263 [Ruditapes philippinarum]
MMNKTIEGIFGDPTTQFNFCLHDKLNSVQNCTNGLFASLPLQTQQYLWSRIFDNASEIDIGNENKTENGKIDLSVMPLIFGALLLLLVVIVMMTNGCILKIRSFKKVWKKNTIIRVPEIEDENVHIEMQLLREDNSSKEENERSTLLQYEKETNTDDDTSTGYGSQSSILTEHCSWQNSCELISTNISNQVEKDLFKGNLTLPDETPHSSVFVKYEMKSETLDSFIAKEKVADNYNLVKTKITVLQSPTKNIDPMDCSTIVENSNGVSVLEGTNLEIERLDWSRIFCFLIKQIDPKIYEIFFTHLLENAGATNVNNIIESVKREKNSVMGTLFALFQRWMYGAGSSAKPKDIEVVFETLEWNAQLKYFREFMRNPPYLPENRSWTNFSIPDYRTVETGQVLLPQPQLFQIQSSDKGQSQIRDISLLSENIEEKVCVKTINNDSVYEIHRKIRRRRCHDDSEVSTKYMRLDDRSTHDREEKISLQHQNRKRGKGNHKSKYSKMVHDKTRVSLSKRNSFNAHCPPNMFSAELPSETQISTSKPTELLSSSSSTEFSYAFSSGYGSGSLINDDLTSNLNESNHTCNEGLHESISKPESSEFISKPLSFSANGNCQYHRQPQITMKFKSKR